MLRFLSIKRFAVIDSVEVEFGPGLNVLTGETGAGKSILVEAVGLLLGGRASGDLVRTGEHEASVEAIFEIGGADVVVRRDITAQGRSRAFIDGRLATAGALKDLSARLVELHGQDEHQTLRDPETHLGALDAFGALDPLLTRATETFEAMRAAQTALSRARRDAADRESRQEIVEFQLAELDRAELKPGEDVELGALRQVLANAERVERLCTESYALLYENDEAVLAALGGVWRRVAELAALDPTVQPYLEGRDAIKAQLEDLAVFLRKYADGIEASPERLQSIENRLATLERLKRKYGTALDELIARRERLRREVADLRHSDERAGELERARSAAREAYIRAAEALSTARRGVARTFSKALVDFVAELAMGETRFEVRFRETPTPEAAWGPQGFDAAEFFLSPNPGEDLRPLARIVSGGELSRVMLAVKTLTGQSRFAGSAGDRGNQGASADVGGAGAPGLIFDEIDAGIGGRVAEVVGIKLRGLGSAFQVLCITHLPQIAVCADAHFKIEKHVQAGRTQTTVTRLDEQGRIEELGRMLGGASVTDGLRASAREMLDGRRRNEETTKGESETAKGEALRRHESEKTRQRATDSKPVHHKGGERTKGMKLSDLR